MGILQQSAAPLIFGAEIPQMVSLSFLILENASHPSVITGG
jgi:hypothetical protein